MLDDKFIWENRNILFNNLILSIIIQTMYITKENEYLLKNTIKNETYSNFYRVINKKIILNIKSIANYSNEEMNIIINNFIKYKKECKDIEIMAILNNILVKDGYVEWGGRMGFNYYWKLYKEML